MRLPLIVALTLTPAILQAQRTEADFVTKDFRFVSGETLPELRIHYTTLGKPQKDASGVVRNAVLMLHGTTGSGSGLVGPMSPLFGPGELLDTTKYFIVRSRERRVG